MNGRECCKMHQQKFEDGEISLVTDLPIELGEDELKKIENIPHPPPQYTFIDENKQQNSDSITYERRNIKGSIYVSGALRSS